MIGYCLFLLEYHFPFCFVKERVVPVGRLDMYTSGALILTNDGEMANKILESENMHEKEYIVTVDKSYDEEFINKMSSGVEILGVKSRPCKMKRVSDNTFKIVLTQGLNRQIRRMCKALGYNVIVLKRIRILNLYLDDMEIGTWRYFSENELY